LATLKSASISALWIIAWYLSSILSSVFMSLSFTSFAAKHRSFVFARTRFLQTQNSKPGRASGDQTSPPNVTSLTR
jgi:hypothetical protein